MAERTQAEIENIKGIIIAHQNWLKRKGGKRADLSFRDLTGLNLPKIDLTGAKLSGASLCGAKLMGANLSQCDLFGADLEGANLTGANLSAADLRGANLHKAALTAATLRGADLRAGAIMADGGAGSRQGGAARLTEAQMDRSILAGANFAGCDLSGADLADADLSGAELTGAVLVGTDLSGATLDGAAFNGTVIDPATLSRTYIPFALPPDAIAHPSYAAMDKDAFMEAVAAHERWVESEGREGHRLDLDLVMVPDTDLSGRILSAARIRRCRFPKAKWRKVGLEMADLSYCDLEGGDLSEADLRGTTLRRAHLGAAKLAGANAKPLMLAGGKPWPTNLDGADLSFADLRNADFGAAILLNTKLDGAKLDGSGIAPPSPDSVPPPRPSTPTEQRKQKRYVRPVIMVQTERGVHHSRNWSLGGMCFRIYDQEAVFRRGEVVKATLTMADRMDINAQAEFIVLSVNPQKGQVSVRFERYGDDLKAFLKFAFQENVRLGG
ncbi:MAG TPA: pentapeptide repeat-containing protein [Azospirillum sp.]|nr:pentapeptide repeat-containing protein [Azospirillum sp.]